MGHVLIWTLIKSTRHWKEDKIPGLTLYLLWRGLARSGYGRMLQYLESKILRQNYLNYYELDFHHATSFGHANPGL